jgi:hypothetical protein
MLLHNFIKNENVLEMEELDWRPQDTPAANTERAFPLVSDNNEQYPRGRRSVGDDFACERGEMIRRSIAIHLQMEGLRRPLHSGMRYNEYGHVYFDE